VSSTGSLLAGIGEKGIRFCTGQLPGPRTDDIMLDIQFEIGGRKLDPCFIGDSIEKAMLLYVARLMRKKFGAIRVTDSEEPPRVLITGKDVGHLRYELAGPESVLNQVGDRAGAIRHEEITVTA